MAIKMDIITADDNTINNAYFRIVTTIVEWEINQCVIIMGAWKGKSAYENKKRQLSLETGLTFRMDFVLESEIDSKEKLYTWLKTQEFFLTATEAQE
jgi:hypothetical protein